jgi:hypothetical protein
MMTSMDATRFAALAEAHGGAIARWPAAEQDAAYGWLAEAPDLAQAVLNEAQALDEMLRAVRPPSPSAALRDHILALAPQPRAPVRPAGRLWRWLAGAGVGAALAASCAGGVAVGIGLTAASPPAVSPAAPQEAMAEAADEAAAPLDDDWMLLPDVEAQS